MFNASVVRVAQTSERGDVWNGGYTDSKYENVVINRQDNPSVNRARVHLLKKS